jgi:stage II sporulation protein D
MHSRKIKYTFILFLLLFFFGGIPSEFGNEGTFFHGFMIPKPVIRIGLGSNLKNLKIRASSGMKIYEISSSYELIAEDADEVLIKGGGDRLSEKYVLLVAHAGDREEADLLAADLKSKVSGRITVEEDFGDSGGGVFEVKLGDFLTRGDALKMIQELAALGLKDVWIEREVISVEESKPLWMLLENELLPLNERSELYFIPANAQSYLSYNGRSYRGLLTVKGTKRGIVLVNLLNLEEYLKSVVPGELSPGLFGSLEALKAQAVAARTYAIKNMGRFNSLGYDLVNTPRSQIYRGMVAEHPLSSQAVEETWGEVLRYKGQLINALYTSTCGGKTENVENVFSGKPAPYLRSVECTYEKQPEWRLETKSQVQSVSVGGRNAAFDIAPLVSLGVIPLDGEPFDFRENAASGEAAEWIAATAGILGLEPDLAPPSDPLDHVGLAGLLISAFHWEERVNQLLLPSEINFLLEGLPQVQGEGRGPLAYCLQSGVFPSSLRTGDPSRPVTRAELASALSRILRDGETPFHSGVFRSAAKGTIEVGLDYERKTLTLSPKLFLVRNLDGTSAFASRLTLLGGEEVRWIERDGQVEYLEVFYPPNSNVLDRSSRYNLWRVRKTTAELEKRLQPSYPIGRLLDLSVIERGASNRATELLVKGSEGESVISGFQIRSALGLRDTLFVIDREYDESGAVAAFTFSGRGWGHGVGLCQVGAYGMALAGAEYKEILKKYYQGTKLDKLY